MIQELLNRAWRLAAVAALAALMAGCASTRLVSHWSDPQYQGGPLKKVAVFVAAKDETVRRAAEDQAVRELSGATKGVASYTLFPEQAAITKANEAALKARLQKEGIDGAVVVRLQSVDKNTVYVPPQTIVTPGMAPGVAPYGTFYGYYGYAYSYSYTTPGFTYEETKYLVECIVYRLPQGNMIWTATTESVNPDSRAQLSEEVRRVLGQELVRDKILAR